MKKLVVSAIILLFAFSCKKKETYSETILEAPIEDSTDIGSFEKEIENIAIGGNGIIFEDGQMSFDIESLEKSAKQVENQLISIKEDNSYESDSIKQNAIESMELNLNLFRGEFCCTTHDGDHCEDSKNLRKLQKAYNCQRFKKKNE